MAVWNARSRSYRVSGIKHDLAWTLSRTSLEGKEDKTGLICFVGWLLLLVLRSQVSPDGLTGPYLHTNLSY